VEHLKGASLCLTRKHCIRLERPARDKHSSFLQTFVNYRREMFYSVDPRGARGNIRKKFYDYLTITLRLSVVSLLLKLT
jgi:hypothetical protein